MWLIFGVMERASHDALSRPSAADEPYDHEAGDRGRQPAIAKGGGRDRQGLCHHPLHALGKEGIECALDHQDKAEGRDQLADYCGALFSADSPSKKR